VLRWVLELPFFRNGFCSSSVCLPSTLTYSSSCTCLPIHDIQHRSPWNQWSFFRSEYLQEQGELVQNPEQTWYQLTCAMAGHQCLEARMPALPLWLRPCNSPLVVAVHGALCARKTSVKVDRVLQSSHHLLALPKSSTHERYTPLGNLLEVATRIALPVDAKGTGETPDCKLRRLSAGH
jgi:hypothetical protein